MSLGIGAYKVGGARQCSMQPCEQPSRGTVTLNNSVEYLPTNTYLALTSRGSEGWEKTKAQNGMQTASYCNSTLRKNCKQAAAYVRHKVPLVEVLGHPI